MKSILHNKKERTCYLCKLIYQDETEKAVLQEHHVFFGPDRKWSEMYGLKVYLCLAHHTEGKEAVHKNAEMAKILKRRAQMEFMKRYSIELFMKVFKRNYLDRPVEELADRSRTEGSKEAAGITFL